MGKRKVDKSMIGKHKFLADGKYLNIQVYELMPNKKNIEQRKSYHYKTIYRELIPDTIPFVDTKETRERHWLGTGFQTDDINCSSEYTVTIREYDKVQLNRFAIQCATKINVSL